MHPAGDQEALAQFQARHDLTGLDAADLALALTHRSFAYENDLPQDNERLEFLGDAVIAAIASEYLFQRDSSAREGELSKRRAQLVSRRVLGLRAAEMGLGDLLRLGRGERDTGGAARASNLGSALEALAGIIYLRLGFDAARRFVIAQVLDPLIRDAPSHALLDLADAKSILQEWVQQHFKMVPTYEREGEEGPEHAKRFRVRVTVGRCVLATGLGQRIKAAENDAAWQALERIRAGDLTPRSILP